MNYAGLIVDMILQKNVQILLMEICVVYDDEDDAEECCRKEEIE